jgi:hypothetical protein
MANGLISRVRSIFKRENPDDGLPASRTSQMSPGDMSRDTWLNNSIWKVDAARRAVYQDIENMDDNCEITSQALDTLAEVAIGLEEEFHEAFSVVCDDQRVQTILNALVHRLNLRREAKDIIRKMLKHGNEFREIVVAEDSTGQLKIFRLKEDIPCFQIYPNIDEYGNLDPKYPWIQKASDRPAEKEIKFLPWQLAHWKYGEKVRKLAKPFLQSARRNWKRLQFLEDSMALGRGSRAYMKLIHFVPVLPRQTAKEHEAAIKQYKQNMKTKEFWSWAQGKKASLENPLSVETDYFLPDDGSGRGRIEVVDPKNSNLQNIDDVIYSQSKFICRTGVPRRRLNIEGAKTSSLNQGEGKDDDKQFVRKVRDIQYAFMEGLSFIFNLELMLHGINPFNKDFMPIYTIEMSKVNAEDEYRKAQAVDTMADAATKWAKLADMPEELMFDKFFKPTEKERQQYLKEFKLRTKPNPAFLTGGSALNEPGTPKGQRPGSDIRDRGTSN